MLRRNDRHGAGTERVPGRADQRLARAGHSVGAPRVVRGVRIEHVCGDPNLSPDRDRELRYRIVSRALDALRTSVARPTVFEPHGGEAAR